MRPPSDGVQAAGYLAAIIVAVATGGSMYRLFRDWRERSRGHLFVARACAWFVAVLLGQAAAVAVAGPCINCGRMRGGGWDGDPLTANEALTIAGVMALLYAAGMTFLRPPHGDRVD